MNDILDKLKMFEYKKYIFQCVGYMVESGSKFGHSWAEVYDPIKKKFKLIEATKDQEYSYLPSVNSKYTRYFTLNFKKVFKQHKDWRVFL